MSAPNSLTEDIKARIKEMWETGMTASQIGAAVGKTKNSVISYVRRLRKNGVAIEHPVIPQARKERPPPKPQAKIIPFPKNNWSETDDEEEVGAEIVSMHDLRLFMCRFVADSPNGYNTAFCGKRTNGFSSYCERHRKVCYRPPARPKKISSSKGY